MSPPVGRGLTIEAQILQGEMWEKNTPQYPLGCQKMGNQPQKTCLARDSISGENVCGAEKPVP